MSHIFVSYNQDDSDFVEILRNKLVQEGFKVWIDTDGLRGGEEWRKSIDQAIKEAFALIVVITPEAKASEYVTYEWAFAAGAEIKVIPLLLKRTSLHPRLESLQYLDFTHRQNRPWDKLFPVLSEADASQPEVEKNNPKKVEIENKRERNAYERMIKALRDENWTWRSIHTLSAAAGVSEEEAIEILRYNPDIVFSIGKSKRKIAKLKNR